MPLDFCFPEGDRAEQGLKDGTYYMVITIPEDFSACAATVTEEKPEKMQLVYQTNPGTNYIASKMSESAMKELGKLSTGGSDQNLCQVMFGKIEEQEKECRKLRRDPVRSETERNSSGW